MNHVALRRLIGGSLLVWVVCTVMLMTHSVPQQQRVGAQEAPTAMATAEGSPEQVERPLYLPLVLQGQGTTTAPTAPADADYATVNWDILVDSPIPGDPNDVSLAFRLGYNADAGSPVSDIILGFGRQVDPDDVERECLPSDVWGVQLVRQSEADLTGCRGIRDEEWVKEVAIDYIEGYFANPDHPTTSIGIGTSNANYPWGCDDPSWREGGRAWRALIEDIAVAAQPYESRIFVRSAIDIESWNDEFDDGWVPCGDAAIVWFDAFEGRSGLRFNMNFGSDAFNERPDQWTRRQVYDVFSGRTTALAYPQIYCDNTDTADEWAQYVRFFPICTFLV